MPSIMVTNPIRPHLNRIATECHLSAMPAAIAAKHIRAQLVTFMTSFIARPRSTTAWHAAGNAAQEQLVALKSTVFKAELQINDLDRHYYRTHALTLAQHPSETDERLMVRLLAFALHADDALAFGQGLSTSDEPDLWRKDLTGAIDLWIDVGLPEVRLLRKAAGRAAHVVVYSYGRGAEQWWTQNRSDCGRLDNLSVYRLPTATTEALAALIRRTMQLQCTIQDGDISLSSEDGVVEVQRETLKAAPAGERGSHR